MSAEIFLHASLSDRALSDFLRLLRGFDAQHRLEGDFDAEATIINLDEPVDGFRYRQVIQRRRSKGWRQGAKRS